MRLTGLIPIDDDEFSTVKQNAGPNAAASLLAVLTILWLALRSARIIFAVAVSITLGLAISAAWGLFLVGALNLISVAFFVLFVGLGIDFGIQFSVRYRAERHDIDDLHGALHSTAVKVGGPLALAAAATAVGFSSFLPTDYRGLSELGQIAGSGMIIAFLTSITVLPALLTILNPPGEPHPMGFKALAPVDREAGLRWCRRESRAATPEDPGSRSPPQCGIEIIRISGNLGLVMYFVLGRSRCRSLLLDVGESNVRCISPAPGKGN